MIRIRRWGSVKGVMYIAEHVSSVVIAEGDSVEDCVEDEHHATNGNQQVHSRPRVLHEPKKHNILIFASKMLNIILFPKRRTCISCACACSTRNRCRRGGWGWRRGRRWSGDFRRTPSPGKSWRVDRAEVDPALKPTNLSTLSSREKNNNNILKGQKLGEQIPT